MEEIESLKKKKKNQAKTNKRMGSNFEGAIRKALNNKGQFIYVKGVSTKGIDILSLKNDNILFIELKSHVEYKKYQFKEAMEQLKANEVIVNDMRNKTNFLPENIKYILIYYIKNVKLIINDVNGQIKEFIKTRDVDINTFLINSLNDYGIL